MIMCIENTETLSESFYCTEAVCATWASITASNSSDKSTKSNFSNSAATAALHPILFSTDADASSNILFFFVIFL